MTPKQFVNAPSRNGLHALVVLRTWDIEWEIAIGINAIFGTLTAGVSERVGGGNDDGASGGDEACEPLAKRGGDPLGC